MFIQHFEPPEIFVWRVISYHYFSRIDIVIYFLFSSHTKNIQLVVGKYEITDCVNHKINHTETEYVDTPHLGPSRSIMNASKYFYLRRKNCEKFRTLNVYNVCGGTHNYITIVSHVIILRMIFEGCLYSYDGRFRIRVNEQTLKVEFGIFIDLFSSL